MTITISDFAQHRANIIKMIHKQAEDSKAALGAIAGLQNDIDAANVTYLNLSKWQRDECYRVTSIFHELLSSFGSENEVHQEPFGGEENEANLDQFLTEATDKIRRHNNRLEDKLSECDNKMIDLQDEFEKATARLAQLKEAIDLKMSDAK
jgi:hypothetical protein